jgi:hypothetical protein
VANYIDVTVDDPDKLLNASMYGAGAIIRLQSGATETGAFANEATAELIAGTRSYTLYDTDGTSSTWYRTRYENAGGTTFSDWSAAFQVSGELAGYLCSLPDAKQRLGISYADTSEDENVLEYIRQVSSFIEHYVGRKLSPDPASGTRTYRLHTRAGYSLWIPKGIRSITTLGIATEDQPESGGTYTFPSATTYYIDPPEYERDAGWPGTRICFRSTSGQQFYTASFGAEVTGAFGFAATPPDVQGVALRLVVREHAGRGSPGGEVATINIDGSRSFEYALSLRDRATLDHYRVLQVA